MSKSPEMLSTRNTPLRRNAASSTSSDPARAPVWEAAACPAASVRPAFMTMMGLVRATSRAADKNERASPMDSM